MIRIRNTLYFCMVPRYIDGSTYWNKYREIRTTRMISRMWTRLKTPEYAIPLRKPIFLSRICETSIHFECPGPSAWMNQRIKIENIRIQNPPKLPFSSIKIRIFRSTCANLTHHQTVVS